MCSSIHYSGRFLPVRRLTVACLVICFLTLNLLAGPAYAKSFWDDGLTFTTAEEDFRATLGALLQPRFEYEDRESDNVTHTSFSLQRARVQLKGYAYTEHLKYRILSEFAQNPTLLEGWIQYERFDPYRIRMGQMTVPFNRERDIPVTKLLTTERSPASAEFNWPSGRDAGLMISRKREKGLEYRVGIFGGQGINSTRSTSNGLMASGRATYEIFGDYERSESFFRPVEGRNLTVGSGLLYAHKNTARNWYNSLGVTAGSDTANVLGLTLDVQFRQGPWNASVSVFEREIDHYLGQLNDIDGEGFTLQGGYIVVPQTLYTNLRHVQAYPNENLTSTRVREHSVGLHLFQQRHNSQVRFEAGLREEHTGTDWADDYFFRVQQQLSF